MGLKCSNEVNGRPKLNVIFHGLFTFVEDLQPPEQQDAVRVLTVLIPDLCSDHLYKAGNWLAETTLAKGADLRLEGVTGFTGPTPEIFNSRHNLAIDGATVSNQIPRYATLRLPYPSSPAHSLRRLTIPVNGLVGNTANIEGRGPNDTDPFQSPTVQVLTYDIENEQDLRLVGNLTMETSNNCHPPPSETPYGGHPWEPVFENGYVNLHIFSEPELPPTEEHIRHAFDTSMRLLSSDLRLVYPAQAAKIEAEKNEIRQGVLSRSVLRGEVLPGVHEIELQDLIGRNRWFAILGRAIKGYRDINYIWEDPTAFSGSDPDTCTGCNVGS